MKPPLATTTLTLIVLAAFGLLLAGCYTVLVHPTVETTGENTSPRMCSDCHSSPDYYYWHFPSQYNWYSRNPSWGRYYHDPWWYDNYWYWKDDGGHGTPRAPQGHLWQPLTPPSSGSQPVVTPGTSGNAQNPNKSSDTGTGNGGEVKRDSGQGHLWQPLVPPKPAEPAKPDDSSKPDDSKKAEDPAGEKTEEQ